jgi:hypothetical protein
VFGTAADGGWGCIWLHPTSPPATPRYWDALAAAGSLLSMAPAANRDSWMIGARNGLHIRAKRDEEISIKR